MFLKKIVLKKYRKFEEKTVDFFKNKIIFIGENASGKTTILEGICVLSSTKTPKNSELSESIKIGESFLTVSGTILSKKSEKELFVSYSNGIKKAKIDGIVSKKISDYSKELNVIYFQPLDSLKYAVASQNRRNLIDSYICQISDQYFEKLIEYKKVIKEKNALLKMDNFSNLNNNYVLLKMFNEKIEKLSEFIIKKRNEETERINNKIYAIHKKFSDDESASIMYLPNLKNVHEDIFDSMINDVECKTTTKGVHKDDFEFLINGKNIAHFCSQGQQKSFILSLKIAILELIKEKKGEYPLLLLDDAFSDLDSKRQNAIFNAIDKNCQLFISTTSLKQLNEEVVNNAQIIEITKGEESYE